MFACFIRKSVRSFGLFPNLLSLQRLEVRFDDLEGFELDESFGQGDARGGLKPDRAQRRLGRRVGASRYETTL